MSGNLDSIDVEGETPLVPEFEEPCEFKIPEVPNEVATYFESLGITAEQIKTVFGVVEQPDETTEVDTEPVTNNPEVYDAQTEEQHLRKLWGSAFDTNVSSLTKLYKTLPEDLKDKYGAVGGTEKLWRDNTAGKLPTTKRLVAEHVTLDKIANMSRKEFAEYEKGVTEKLKQGYTFKTHEPTNQERTPKPTKQPHHRYTQSQIMNMSKQEYRRLTTDIAKAWAQGAVYKDVGE